MRALIVCPDYPYPINGGNKVAVHGYICALKELGCDEIDLVVFDRTQPQEGKDAFKNIWTMPIPWKFDLRKLWTAFMAGESYLFSRYSSEHNKTFLKKNFEKNKYDCILVEHAYMAQDLPEDVVNDRSIVKIVSSDVLEGRALTQKAILTGNFLRRLLYSIEAKKAEREEFRILGNFKTVFFYCDEDLQYFRHKTGLKGGCKVNLGLDMERYVVVPRETGPSKVVVFYGACSWYPNADALRYLLEDIWPLVAKKRNDVLLRIAGRGVPDWAYKFTNRQVEIVGEVSSMQKFVASSDVVLSPVRIGGGVRLKILEAMAWGRPVISTSIGLEGNEVSNQSSVRVANSPEEFLVEIELLLSDSGLWDDCVCQGLQYIKREYDYRENLVVALREAGGW